MSIEQDFEYKGYTVRMILNSYSTKFSFSYQVTEIQSGLVINQLGTNLEEHEKYDSLGHALSAQSEVIRKIDAYIKDK